LQYKNGVKWWHTPVQPLVQTPERSRWKLNNATRKKWVKNNKINNSKIPVIPEIPNEIPEIQNEIHETLSNIIVPRPSITPAPSETDEVVKEIVENIVNDVVQTSGTIADDLDLLRSSKIVSGKKS
jgi:hypothetical protein